MPIVVDRIRAALVRLPRVLSEVGDLGLEELDLTAVSDCVWILSRATHEAANARRFYCCAAAFGVGVGCDFSVLD